MEHKEDYMLPLVSFIIPTYNAEKHINKCLLSIEKQTYPKERIEILVIDGGSSDRTLDITKRFSVKIIENVARIAEVAKSLGIQAAQGKYVAIFDADNEIVQDEWLERMILPLETDASIIGMDATYLVKRNDYIVNRYCTLLRLEDPLVRYMANLADNSVVEEKLGHSLYKIKDKRFPIFGSGGFIWRREILDEIGIYIPRFDEAEFCIKVIEKGHTRIGFIKAMGIYHHHTENIAQFFGKRIRRGKEFIFRSLMTKDPKKKVSGVWLDKYSPWEFLRAVFLCISFIYPTYECVKGYLRDKDVAWVLHPFLSFLTVIVYGFIFLKFKILHYNNCLVDLFFHKDKSHC